MKRKKKTKQNSFDLSLQSGHNLLTGLHHSIQLSRHHDGEALIFCQGEFQVGSSLLHDINTDLRLVSLPKLVHVLVLAFFKWHVENLVHQRKKRNQGAQHPFQFNIK